MVMLPERPIAHRHLAPEVVDPLPPPKTDVELAARIQEKLHPTGNWGCSRGPAVSTYVLEDEEHNHTPNKPMRELTFDPLPPPKTDAELAKITNEKDLRSMEEALHQDEQRATAGCAPKLLGV